MNYGYPGWGMSLIANSMIGGYSNHLAQQQQNQNSQQPQQQAAIQLLGGQAAPSGRGLFSALPISSAPSSEPIFSDFNSFGGLGTSAPGGNSALSNFGGLGFSPSAFAPNQDPSARGVY